MVGDHVIVYVTSFTDNCILISNLRVYHHIDIVSVLLTTAFVTVKPLIDV